MNAILNISFSGFLPEIGDLFNLIVAGENSNFGFDEVNLIGARGFAPRMKTTKVFTTAVLGRLRPSLTMPNNHLRGVHRANSRNLGANPPSWVSSSQIIE